MHYDWVYPKIDTCCPWRKRLVCNEGTCYETQKAAGSVPTVDTPRLPVYRFPPLPRPLADDRYHGGCVQRSSEGARSCRVAEGLLHQVQVLDRVSSLFCRPLLPLQPFLTMDKGRGVGVLAPKLRSLSLAVDAGRVRGRGRGVWWPCARFRLERGDERVVGANVRCRVCVLLHLGWCLPLGWREDV